MEIDPKSLLLFFRKMILTACVISGISIGVLPACYGQSPGIRPKVGLALSGGGACGIAHLGVLKVMEEAGLRPDYITGVSMGSIIGGLYSIGYSADTLEYLFSNTDWDDILSGRIPENKVIFPEKKHFMNSIISLPVTFKKVKLPSGLVNGQQIESMLSYYAWPAADINDFSKLPIPFQCIAADIINNKKVVLKTGYLPDAIRASIAVPSLLTPLRIDTLLLLDGGFKRNFAASELKDMGADIIIGSYTGFKKHTAAEVETITDVLKQIGLSGSLQDYQEQKQLVDLLIEPPVEGCSPTRFSESDTLIRRGYEAALPYKGYFKKLADSLDKIARQIPIENILDKRYYSFDKIEINGNRLYSDDQILGVLDIRPGENTDRNNLTDKIELLYGKSWFEKVKYRFVKKPDTLILAVDCIERPKAMFYGSVHYDNALKAGAILGVSIKDPVTRGSQFDLNSSVGEFYRLSAEYTQYMDIHQKYGVSLFFYADNTYIPFFKSFNETGGTYSRNVISGLAVNRRIGLNHVVTLSGEIENMVLDHNYISDSGIEKLNTRFASGLLAYRINTLDNKHFPDRGLDAYMAFHTSKLLNAKYFTDSTAVTLGKDEPFPEDPSIFYTLHGSISHYFTRYKNWTFSARGDFVYITDTDSISSQNSCFFAGGAESVSTRSIPLTGFHPVQLQVTRMAAIDLGIDYEIIEKVHLNFTASIAAINDLNSKSDFSILAGAGAGAGYLSVIGPIRAGIMYGFYEKEEYFKRLKGYLSIGFKF